VITEDDKEVKKTEDGKAVKDIGEKEVHGRTSCLRRSKEEAITSTSEGKDLWRSVEMDHTRTLYLC
jgi:hypothetical protein